MATLKIQTETGGILDLLDGTESLFYITRQIHDLHNLQTREADFTRTLDLPATDNNLNILGASQAIGNTAGAVSTKVQVSIQLNGIMVAPTAFLLHTRTTNRKKIQLLEVVLLYGNFNLFDAILPGSINTLNWADLAVLWEPANLEAISNTETGICYAFAWWFGDSQYNASNTTNQDINFCGFWMYAFEIITRIINEAGFTLQTSDLPQEFHDFALACPIDKFIEPTVFEGASLRAEVQNTLAFTADGQTRIVEFDNVIVDPSNIWHGAPDWWYEPTTVTTFNITVKGQITYLQGNPNNVPCEVRILLNGGIIATALFAGTQVAPVDFFLTFTSPVSPADTIQIEIFSELRANGNSIITFEPNVSFAVATPDNEDRTVQPSEHIPPINKKAFLTAVLTQFNLLLTTDSITKVVSIVNFDDIYKNKEQNWSEFLDVGSNIIIENAVDGYYQDSHLKYAEDESLRRNDIDYIKNFENEILGLEGDIILQPFTLCDICIWREVTEPDLAIVPMTLTETESTANDAGDILDISAGLDTFDMIDPAFVLGFQIGDYIGGTFNNTFSNFNRRIIQKTTETSGVVSVPWDSGQGNLINYTILRYTPNEVVAKVGLLRNTGVAPGLKVVDLYQGGGIGNFTQVASPAKVANATTVLRFSEIANNTYYKNLFEALDAPQLVKAFFNLPVAIFEAIDFTRPVYISYFNAFYYINRISQYKAESKTQVELIRISVLTE